MTTRSPALILIRHLETDAGASAGDEDPPLSERGRKGAVKLIDALRPYQVKQMYASDLKRARETALLIAKGLQVPVELRSELREIAPHSLEEMASAEQIVTDGVETLISRHRDGTIAIVAHSGAIRATIRDLLGFPLNAYDGPGVANGAFVVLRQIGKGWQSAG